MGLTMSSHKLTFKQLLILCLCTLIIGCEPPTTTAEIEFRVPVTVEEIEAATIEDRIVTTGTLRAPELVTLTVMTAGLLQIDQGSNGRLAEGDHVKAGDQIGSITGEDVRLATRREAALQKLQTAERNLEATSTLYERDLVTVSQFGLDQNAFEEAKLEYERSLHTENSNKIITPIDGVILSLARDSNGQLMANGQLVTQGQAIAQIAALDSLVADVDLVGQDIARVHVGQEARANYHAFGERTFPGEVLRLAPTINESTRALRAEVQIDNKQGLLRPGMFVEVTMVSERRVQVPVVARRSLTDRGGRRVVVGFEGQRAVQREVVLGLGSDEVVEVRSGLELGESVVVLGLETLTDQMPVSVTGN
jgi:membrane fusion protein (multidrug efflux system)